LILAPGVPQRVTAINFVADTLLFAGMMFAIAREVAARLGDDANRPLSVEDENRRGSTGAARAGLRRSRASLDSLLCQLLHFTTW
jgi:hypothetical protein